MKFTLKVLSFALAVTWSLSGFAGQSYCRKDLMISYNHQLNLNTLIKRNINDTFYPKEFSLEAAKATCNTISNGVFLERELKAACEGGGGYMARATITARLISEKGIVTINSLSAYCQDYFPENYRCRSFDKVKKVWVDHPDQCGGSEGGQEFNIEGGGGAE